eukprot:TRINITY_DN5243_c0_g1_i2.p1 TRINITY_DN5243_c0_g1~~TRINITY_DN5243_c0_g1_i2.p1  ORF type:complete len:692 (-),score=136.83 TRINITY_DN5243_c0_g1_i2:448-2523(-)
MSRGKRASVAFAGSAGPSADVLSQVKVEENSAPAPEVKGGRGRRASVAEVVQQLVVGPAADQSESKDVLLERMHQEAAAFDPLSIERDELATANAALSFKNVAFRIKIPDPDDPKEKISKTILEECSGHIPAGSLVALMGPSGCGKSTLMDILAKKKTAKWEGQVFINGREPDHMYQRITSYVGQQDIMPQHWTVREAVAFDAGLKRPKPPNVSWSNFYTFVDTILEDVGLLHVKDTKIGGPNVRGISGGQRRRVTLARGIAANPNIMFCDEPTSGLSATDAELCVKTMVGMTRRWNTTIIVVIHQPRMEVANLFDRLILLTSRPGRIVYNGPMTNAQAYWTALGSVVPKSVNPTDHFLDVITPGAAGADPDRFANHYREVELPKEKAIMEEAISVQGATPMELLQAEREALSCFGYVPPVRKGTCAKSSWTQFCFLLHRKVKLTFIDVEVIFLNVILKIVMGFVYGIIYQGLGNREPKGITQLSFMYMLSLDLAMAVQKVLPIIIMERTVMKLEVSEGLYGVGPHLLAQGLVDTALFLVGNTFQTAIAYWLAELPWDAFPVFFACLLVSGFAIDSVALCFATIGSNEQMALVCAFPVVMTYNLFCGFLVSKKSAPGYLKWLLEVSPVYWCMEMMSWELYGHDPAAWGTLEFAYGFEEPSAVGFIIVNVLTAIVGRIGQVITTKKFNNIAK